MTTKRNKKRSLASRKKSSSSSLKNSPSQSQRGSSSSSSSRSLQQNVSSSSSSLAAAGSNSSTTAPTRQQLSNIDVSRAASNHTSKPPSSMGSPSFHVSTGTDSLVHSYENASPMMRSDAMDSLGSPLLSRNTHSLGSAGSVKSSGGLTTGSRGSGSSTSTSPGSSATTRKRHNYFITSSESPSSPMSSPHTSFTQSSGKSSRKRSKSKSARSSSVAASPSAGGGTASRGRRKNRKKKSPQLKLSSAAFSSNRQQTTRRVGSPAVSSPSNTPRSPTPPGTRRKHRSGSVTPTNTSSPMSPKRFNNIISADYGMRSDATSRAQRASKSDSTTIVSSDDASDKMPKKDTTRTSTSSSFVEKTVTNTEKPDGSTLQSEVKNSTPTSPDSSSRESRGRSNSFSTVSKHSKNPEYNITYYSGQQDIFEKTGAHTSKGEDTDSPRNKKESSSESSQPASTHTTTTVQSSEHTDSTQRTSPLMSSHHQNSPHIRNSGSSTRPEQSPLSPSRSRYSSVNRFSHTSSRSSRSTHHYHNSLLYNAPSATRSSYRTSSGSTSRVSYPYSLHQFTLNLLDSTALPHHSIPACAMDQSRHLPHLISKNFSHFEQYDYNTDMWNDLQKPPKKRRKSIMASMNARREGILSMICRKEALGQEEKLYIVSSLRKTSLLEYDFTLNKWKKFKLKGLTKELKKKGTFFPGHTIVYDPNSDQAFFFGGFEKRLQTADRKSSDQQTNSLFRLSFKTRMYEELSIAQKDDSGNQVAPILRCHHSAALWVPSAEAAAEMEESSTTPSSSGSSSSHTSDLRHVYPGNHSHASHHHRSLSNYEMPNEMNKRYMVIFGGESLSGIILKDVWLFDLKKLKWKKLETQNGCTMSRGSKGHRICIVQDKMLVACAQVMSTSYDHDNPEPCTFLSMHQLDLRTKVWSYIDLSISISAQTICGLFTIPFETLKYPYPSQIVITESGLHILSEGNRRGSTKKTQRKIRTVSLISTTSSRDSKAEDEILDSSGSHHPLNRQRSYSTPTWKTSRSSSGTQYAESSQRDSSPHSPAPVTTSSKPNHITITGGTSDSNDLTSCTSTEESSSQSQLSANKFQTHHPSTANIATTTTTARDSAGTSSSLDSHPSSSGDNSSSIFNKVTIEKFNPKLAKFLYNFQQQERRLSLQQKQQEAESNDGTTTSPRPARPPLLKRKSSRFMVNGRDGKTYTVEIMGDEDEEGAKPRTSARMSQRVSFKIGSSVLAGKQVSQNPIEAFRRKSLANAANTSESPVQASAPAADLSSFGIGFGLNTAEEDDTQKQPFDLKIQFNIDPTSKTGQGMTFKTESGTFFYHDIRITENGITSMPRSMRLSMRKSYRNSTMQALLEQEAYQHLDFDDLEEIRQLGHGASSKVFLVQHRETGKEYAMKVIGCEEDFQPELIISEIKAFFRCRKSPYIISFHQAYYIDQEIHMLLEYMNEGSLSDVLASHGKMPESVVGSIAVRVLKGLMHLHEKRIIHRDIKPENILLNNKGIVKIGDFGLIGYKDSRMSIRHSFESETTHFDTPKGTYVYMSPERFEGRKYSYNSDVWSFGMTLVKMRAGQLPFGRSGSYWKLVQEMKRIRDLTLDTSIFSKELRDLIYKCIIFDPHNRPNSEDLLRDPWIQQFEAKGDEENARIAQQWLLSTQRKK